MEWSWVAEWVLGRVEASRSSNSLFKEPGRSEPHINFLCFARTGRSAKGLGEQRGARVALREKHQAGEAAQPESRNGSG